MKGHSRSRFGREALVRKGMRSGEKLRPGEVSRLFWIGVPGPDLDWESQRVLRTTPPGGVVLFGRNVTGELRRLQQLVRDLRRAVPELVIAVDAEGGRVDRLHPLFGRAPSAAALSRKPPSWSERSGYWMGAALRQVGIDLDLAPVLDLDWGIAGNALEERCFGKSPRAVVSRGRAFLDGLRKAGIGGCLKHYPGLGAAPTDTHLRGARIELADAGMEREERPFRKLLQAGHAVALMVGHGVYPYLDPAALPASISPFWIRRLRGHLGFSGLIVSDDLEMGALSAYGELADRSLLALEAGVDALAVCSRLELLPELAGHLARQGRPQEVHQALRRQRRLRWSLQRISRQAPRQLPSPSQIRAALARLLEACQRP